jgi:hypothetical protein
LQKKIFRLFCTDKEWNTLSQPFSICTDSKIFLTLSYTIEEYNTFSASAQTENDKYAFFAPKTASEKSEFTFPIG